MRVYLDASAPAERYVREAGSLAVEAAMAHGPAARSRLSEVEVVSALARQAREGWLSAAERDLALAAWRSEMQRMDLIELTATITARARVLLWRHTLRAGDAIQLASAMHLSQAAGAIAILAYDARLCAAARAEGLRPAV